METMSGLKSLKLKRSKEIMTATLYVCYVAYGIAISIMPPTMLDIAEMLKTKVDDVSLGLAGKSIAYGVSAVFFGWLFNRINRQMGMVCCLAGSAFVLVVVPYVKNLGIFILSQVILGGISSGVDVATNAWLLEIWQEKANPYMIGLHFSFAVGQTLSPLLAEPFLSQEINSNQTHVDHNLYMTREGFIDMGFRNLNDSLGELDDQHHGGNATLHTQTRIFIPYATSALLLLISGMLLFVMSYVFPYSQQTRQASSSSRLLGNQNYESPSMSKETNDTTREAKFYWDYKFLVVLGNILLCFYTGIEINGFSYLPNFVFHSTMRLSKSTGAYMSSVMSAAFAVFRGLNIITATRITSERMLHIHFCILCIGNVLLLIAGLIASVFLTWVSIVIMGIGMSCMFPTICSYMEERIAVTNFLTGMFLFSGSLNTIISPLLVGFLIQKFPLIFVYFNIVSLIVCFAVFVGLCVIERRHRNCLKSNVPHLRLTLSSRNLISSSLNPSC